MTALIRDIVIRGHARERRRVDNGPHRAIRLWIGALCPLFLQRIPYAAVLVFGVCAFAVGKWDHRGVASALGGVFLPVQPWHSITTAWSNIGGRQPPLAAVLVRYPSAFRI